MIDIAPFQVQDSQGNRTARAFAHILCTYKVLRWRNWGDWKPPV